MPLYEYAEYPEKVEFDDDIALLISTLIKLSGQITKVQKTIFPYLERVHAKFNGIFGNLLSCLNMYIVFHNGWFDEYKEGVELMSSMANISMFYNDKKSFNTSAN